MLRIVVIASALAAALATLATSTASADTVGCGSTITTNTTLTTDLVGCTEGLRVSGPVTLDLAGYTVAGVGAGIGIDARGGAIVQGGRVSGFAIAVRLEAATVEGMVVAGNQIGIEAIDFPSGGFSIRGNTITHNAGGIYLLGGSGDVTGNRVTFNSADGISTIAEPVTIEDNDASRNGGRGIYVQDATTRLVGNTASSNGLDGIFVSDVYNLFFPYWFSGNVANDNGGFGIAFTGIPTRLEPPASVDGGGNAAKHNANALQCFQIVCAFNRGLAKQPPSGPVRLHRST